MEAEDALEDKDMRVQASTISNVLDILPPNSLQALAYDEAQFLSQSAYVSDFNDSFIDGLYGSLIDLPLFAAESRKEYVNAIYQVLYNRALFLFRPL